MEKKKVTKKEMFTMIKEMLADNEEIVAFCKHEIDLLSKKSGSRKPTKNQAENELLKEVIVSVLDEKGATVSEIQSKDERLSATKGISNQRVSALLRQLIAEGKADKKVEGKKTLFVLA